MKIIIIIVIPILLFLLQPFYKSFTNDNANKLTKDIACKVKHELFYHKPPDTKFTVLISPLHNDNSHQTQLIRDVFINQDISGINVVQLCNEVSISNEGDLSENVSNAVEHGKHLLHKFNADLLIWGEVNSKNKKITIWFLNKGKINTISNPNAPSAYMLTNKLTLPENFTSQLSCLIAIVALSQTAQAVDLRHRGYIPNQLYSLIAKTKNYLINIAKNDHQEIRTRLLLSLGVANEAIALKTRKTEPLEQAIKRFEQILYSPQINKTSTYYAQARINWATAIMLRVRSQQRTKQLEQSISIFNDTLRAIGSFKKDPIRWYAVKMNLGVAQLLLGSKKANVSALINARKTFNSIVSVFDRTNYPIYWAAAKGNLGRSYQFIADYKNKDINLDKAISNYKAALSAYSQNKNPTRWATIKSFLAQTLHMQGVSLLNTTKLQQAISNFEQALGIWEKGKYPIDYADSQTLLGMTYLDLGVIEPGTENLFKSISAFRSARRIWQRQTRTDKSVGATAYLARAYAMLGVKTGKTDYINKAVSIITSVIKTSNQPGTWEQIAESQQYIGKSLIVFGSMFNDNSVVHRGLTQLKFAEGSFGSHHAFKRSILTEQLITMVRLYDAIKKTNLAELRELAVVSKRAVKNVSRNQQPRIWAGYSFISGLARMSLGAYETNAKKVLTGVKQCNKAVHVLSQNGKYFVSRQLQTMEFKTLILLYKATNGNCIVCLRKADTARQQISKFMATHNNSPRD